MKIQRNDSCPCGSGKKYKHCCISKEDNEEYRKSLFGKRDFDKAISKRLLKQCIHPNQNECSENIVKAHSIQNNKILNRIAEEGEVITLKYKSFPFASGSMTGRKIATTFSGFCGYHDKTTFQIIEDRIFTGSEEQLFLFAYRAFALEYHRKMEEVKSFTNQFKELPSIIEKPELYKYYSELKLGLEDNDYVKSIFDEALNTNEHSCLHSLIWEIPEQICFAVTTAFALEFDVKGKRINDFKANVRLKNIYLNIFPTDDKAYCIISWLEEDDNAYSAFEKQFIKLSNKDKETFINNLLPIYTENIVIGPRLWRSWGEEKQEAFLSLFNMSTFIQPTGHINLLNETSYDFFEVVG